MTAGRASTEGVSGLGARSVTEQQARGALHPLFVAIMRFLPLLSFTAYITRPRRVRVPSTRL